MPGRRPGAPYVKGAESARAWYGMSGGRSACDCGCGVCDAGGGSGSALTVRSMSPSSASSSSGGLGAARRPAEEMPESMDALSGEEGPPPPARTTVA